MGQLMVVLVLILAMVLEAGEACAKLASEVVE